MSRIEIAFPDRSVFQTDIPVRITDLNYAGHVGHDRVLSMTHEARARLLALHGWTELDIEGVGIAVADVAAVYRAESRYGMVISVQVAVAELRTRACDMYYRLIDQKTGSPIADVKTGLVFFDYRTKRVSRMPELFRQAFASVQ